MPALHCLIQHLENDGLHSLGSGWRTWFQQVTEQLEFDDTLEPHSADQIAEALARLTAAITAERDSSLEIDRLLSLYHHYLHGLPLEARWRARAAGLGTAQLDSGTWSDLHLALEAVRDGEHHLVEPWLEETEEAFLSAWESYERSDVLDSEITSESVLGHHLLLEGIEYWMAALVEFRDNIHDVDHTRVMELAEMGQRLLIAVQLMEEETQDPVSRFAAAWGN